jgi:hypothetical protein
MSSRRRIYYLITLDDVFKEYCIFNLMGKMTFQQYCEDMVYLGYKIL